MANVNMSGAEHLNLVDVVIRSSSTFSTIHEVQPCPSRRRGNMKAFDFMKSLSLTLSSKDASTNPRGIPFAPFVDQVEDYVSSRAEVDGTMKSFQEMISYGRSYTNYQES